MSDIHQEWHELRKKNGDFICHLDGEMAKLDKKQVELKHCEQIQHLSDAGAFAMQFVAPPPFNCCQDDRDILKALNKAQADRIKTLEEELLALNDQLKADLSVKKDLDEKLDKAAADYKALRVDNDQLKGQLTAQGKTLANAQACNIELSNINAALCQHNDELKEMAKKANQQRHEAIEMANRLQAKIKNLQTENDILKHAVPSCNTYAQQGMQSKIAKQANEIKRLIKDNESLRRTIYDISLTYRDLKQQFKTSKKENEQLHDALDIAAKDADAIFERGKIKGMEEIWDKLRDCYNGRSTGENEKIFGYGDVADIVVNLSPTWFIRTAKEHDKEVEKKEKDIQIGDEVEVFDPFCPDDNEHSAMGIVVGRDLECNAFEIFGKTITGCFHADDIRNGIVRKTGRHFDTIPLDYFA